MRLVFSTDNHRNTDISDERGQIYYTISTPSARNKVTTITKYNWTDLSNGTSETLGVIEWHSWSESMIQFNGRQMSADMMLQKHRWKWNSNGRTFLGPDERKYKWKLATTHCWMKPADADIELVRSHRKSHGSAHLAYLDVNDRVVSMLDHIILTFVCVEQLRLERKHRSAGPARPTRVRRLPSPPPPLPPPPPTC